MDSTDTSIVLLFPQDCLGRDDNLLSRAIRGLAFKSPWSELLSTIQRRGTAQGVNWQDISHYALSEESGVADLVDGGEHEYKCGDEKTYSKE